MVDTQKDEYLPIQEGHVDELISTLPFADSWVHPYPLRYYYGCWYPQFLLQGGMAFRAQFKPNDSDILTISPPKSGTTWLKALVFATVNRKIYSPFAQDHPLLRMNPHTCIPLIDEILNGQYVTLENTRLFHLHMSFSVLPESVILSNCKMVYICREPKDTFVSTWHFVKKMESEKLKSVSFEEAYEMYCDGVSLFGPIWDHYLGYWRESLRRPEKVLFLKYEDMIEDPHENLRKLAKFIGYPFNEEEEKNDVVDRIVTICSFEKLSAVEANKKGVRTLKDSKLNEIRINNSTYFRKGKVGDWKNHLSIEMAKKLDEIIEDKLRGSGLSFDVHAGDT